MVGAWPEVAGVWQRQTGRELCFLAEVGWLNSSGHSSFDGRRSGIRLPERFDCRASAISAAAAAAK